MIFRGVNYPNNIVNLVLSGGGVKGIAYVGVFETGEKCGYRWGNIAGVSAGALAGSYAAAGYTGEELQKIMNEFDFGKIKLENIPKMVPAVSRFMLHSNGLQTRASTSSIQSYFEEQKDNQFDIEWVTSPSSILRTQALSSNDRSGRVISILKNVVKVSKEGCLFDGDYLEEWVYKVLRAKGIVTFGDLRYGIPDQVNPKGYKVRMSAVDANRARIIVLPDDLAYYGIDPDRFEVAKAVRMSTSVPFAFKPVELKKVEGNSYKTHYLIDGGVLDNFPFWLINNPSNFTTMGFRLDGGKNNELFSLDTPLNILKGFIAAIHDIGKLDGVDKLKHVATIDIQKVSFMDFSLDSEEIAFLINAGKQAAQPMFNSLTASRNFGRAGLYRFMRGFGRHPFS